MPAKTPRKATTEKKIGENDLSVDLLKAKKERYRNVNETKREFFNPRFRHRTCEDLSSQDQRRCGVFLTDFFDVDRDEELDRTIDLL